MHRGSARPYLSSFQKWKESVPRVVGFVHSGPCHQDHSGALECLGVLQAQLTQKVKDRKDSQKDPTIKKRSPL